MDFSEVCEIYEKLEKTSSRLEKEEIISLALKESCEKDVIPLIYLFMGKIFPNTSEQKLDMGKKMIIKSLSSSFGVSEDKITVLLNKYGDIGVVAEKLTTTKTQTTLFSKKLTVDKVFNVLRKLALATGKDSQNTRVSYMRLLLLNAKPIEAKYICRIVAEEMRLGIGEGIIRDSISRAFNVSSDIVDYAYALTNDFGEIIKILKSSGITGLKNIEISPGKPIKAMLAQRVSSISEGLEKTGGKAALEYKYDGMRCQIHFNGEEISLYTRRLENVTSQFPEVISSLKNALRCKNCVIEAEIVAYNETGSKVPFQELSKRIKRKYNIELLAKKLPCSVFAFDILYLNGKMLINIPFKRRRLLLESAIIQTDRVSLSNMLITHSVQKGEDFYSKALSEGHEGVMIKNLKSPYKPGSRVGYMYKLKPVLETLDLVVVGGEWGEGKRKNTFGSLILATRNSKGELLEIGKLGSGLTDKLLFELTSRLQRLITEEKDKSVRFKPEIVVEVAYEEIQRSTTYSSGYALRFPRLIRVRDDLGLRDIDDVDRVKSIYNSAEN